MPDTRLIIFAKAPVPGQVKTRLAVAIGEQRAAELATKMLEHALAQGQAAGFQEIELCCSPDTSHPIFRAAQCSLTEQQGPDLGERMAAAFSRAIADVPRVLMIGTDCPALTPAILQQAASRLTGQDAVFVPAKDGGYVLIGLARYDPSLFHGIAWGSSTVMADTRIRLKALGWCWTELPPLADIDEPADLAYLPAGW